MDLSFWPKVFFFAGCQSVFLAFIFLFPIKINRPRVYLGLILFFFGINLFYNCAYWTESFLDYPHLMGIQLPIYFIYGPLFFLYFDALRTEPKFQRFGFLHFIPSALLTSYYSKYFFLEAASKVELAQARQPVPKVEWLEWASFLGFNWYYYIISMMVYLCLMIIIYFTIKKKRSSLKGRSVKSQVRLKWMLTVLIFYSIFSISFFLYFPLSNLPSFHIAQDYFLSSLMAISIISLAVAGYYYPKVMDGKGFYLQSSKAKYADTKLPISLVESVKAKLNKVMEDRKLYRTHGIKLSDLAENIDVHTHVISQILNSELGKSFNEYVNDWRIKEVASLLQSSVNEKTPISLLSSQAGFGNKTTFNALFKKKYGVSPSEFRKRHKNGQ